MFLFFKDNFPGIPFCRNNVMQKLVPFLPLLPKRNNSPACWPKQSKTCHTQQHNPQQTSPSHQIFQLAHLPLVIPSRPSCLVGCCVAWWPPSASQLAAPPLVVPSVCWLPCGIAPWCLCLLLSLQQSLKPLLSLPWFALPLLRASLSLLLSELWR